MSAIARVLSVFLRAGRRSCRPAPSDVNSRARTASTSRICAVLHGRTGRNFSQYKAGTLMRRTQRRMQVPQTAKVTDYIERLRTSPDEAEMLFHELLINVTQFFRDPEAFAVLEARVIPELLSESHGSDPVRAWVAGCATGEEAYSVAMLIREGMARSGRRRAVQLFATDVDGRAIDVGRLGRAEGRSPARRARPSGEEHPGDRVRRDLADPEDDAVAGGICRRDWRPDRLDRPGLRPADAGGRRRDLAARPHRDGTGRLS